MRPRLSVSIAALVWASAAAADPILELPPVGKGRLAGPPGGVALVLEMSALGVAGAERLTTFPEVGTVRGGEPELAVMRVGLVGVSPCRPWAFAVRLDLSEPLRLRRADLERAPVAAIGRLIDDAAVWWTPHAAAGLIVGRGKVPFSRWRHGERALLSAGAVPFLIDRIAPDRRWGVTLVGDLGALAYAAGAYADAAEVELRTAAGDPSVGGEAAFAAHVEWTARAPIRAGHLASGDDDPWYAWARTSAGAGLLYRRRGDGLPDRLDASLSGQLKYRRLSGVAEAIVSADGGDLELGAAGELGVRVSARAALFARAELDGGAGLWTTAAGATWFVTADRRNKVVFVGWLQRPDDGGPHRDGAVVGLQASL